MPDKKKAVSATVSVKESRRMKEKMKKKHCIYQNKWDMNRTYKPTQRNKNKQNSDDNHVLYTNK